MASRRMAVTAPTSDAISTEEIRRVDVPSTVNLWAACTTAGDAMGLLLNRTEILPADVVNVFASAGVVDTNRDQLLFNTIVGAGQLRLPVTAVNTSLQFLLSVEPIV